MQPPHNKIIKCPQCQIPYLKIAEEHQTFLKWYDGKMNETEIRGAKQIVCFKCNTVIEVGRTITIEST